MKTNPELTLEKIQTEEFRIEKESQSLRKSIEIFKFIGWTLIVFGFIAGCSGILVGQGSTNSLPELGDFFGGVVATLWSLAGLFFIYVAFLGQQIQMLYQNIELLHSRYEMQATREELKGQKEQMEVQSQTFKLQQFESTFFNMISFYYEIINNIEKTIEVQTAGFEYEDQTVKGKYALKQIYLRFKTMYGSTGKSSDSELKKIKKAIQTLGSRYENDLIHYYNTLMAISELIEQYSAEDSKKYVHILRSQLSPSEVALMVYLQIYNPNYRDTFEMLVDSDFFSGVKEFLIKEEHFELLSG